MKTRTPLLRILVILTLYILGFLFLSFAAACIFGYAREIFLSFGSDDKSLLFWYLPILFIGAGAFWVGALCAYAGIRLTRKMKESSDR